MIIEIYFWSNNCNAAFSWYMRGIIFELINDLSHNFFFLSKGDLFCCDASRGGGHLYFRLDIILVKELSKHTLNTYFSGTKIDPRRVFACVFLNLSVMSFPKFVNMPKDILFFPILHVFAPLNDVRAYIAWSWKNNPNYVIFFYEDDIQLQIQVAPGVTIVGYSF